MVSDLENGMVGLTLTVDVPDVPAVGACVDVVEVVASCSIPSASSAPAVVSDFDTPAPTLLLISPLEPDLAPAASSFSRSSLARRFAAFFAPDMLAFTLAALSCLFASAFLAAAMRLALCV